MSDTTETPIAATVAQAQQLQRQLEAQQIQNALRGGVANLYTNGIGLAQTASDVSLVLLNNSTAIGIATFSYTTTKAVIKALSEAVERMEKATQQKIMSNEEITPRLVKVLSETANFKPL